MSVDEDLYRRAMGRFATGVTVVSTRAGEHDHAMTASAICSVSLEPILLLVSVEQEARFHDAVVDAGVFGVSVLDADQRATAEWLATRGRPLHGQLDRIPHVAGEATGVPLIEGSLATFELETTAIHPAGDHSLVVGHVRSVTMNERPGQALLYYRGRFGAVK
ncbi:flavin reductase family protein [Demetria terragena]|uniref:flavin reductase family protein n=1 Tax=Demetria terragena TaxID=63959 RepID=UPI00039B18B9|nr:flavin reductase family protein [Demetria terragena]